MINRADHADNFLSITNDTARATGLSNGAFRLLIFMLSMSDDWNFSVNGLAYMLGWPERTVAKHVTELKRAGYIEQLKKTDDHGRFLPSEWVVHETPVTALHKNRSAVEPQHGETALRSDRSADAPLCGKSVDIRITNIKEQPNIKERPNIKKTRAFKKPTVDEVAAYCQERGNRVDPEHFVDHYEANGWKVGKNPMKDWKATVRTWERNNYDKPKKAEPVFENPFTRLLREEGYT